MSRGAERSPLFAVTLGKFEEDKDELLFHLLTWKTNLPNFIFCQNVNIYGRQYCYYVKFAF